MNISKKLTVARIVVGCAFGVSVIGLAASKAWARDCSQTFFCGMNFSQTACVYCHCCTPGPTESQLGCDPDQQITAGISCSSNMTAICGFTGETPSPTCVVTD